MKKCMHEYCSGSWQFLTLPLCLEVRQWPISLGFQEYIPVCMRGADNIKYGIEDFRVATSQRGNKAREGDKNVVRKEGLIV